MKLITEISDSIKYIVEDTDSGKNFFIQGIFAQANTPNRNKREYPKPVLESALQNFMKLVESKRAVGELNHPASPTINLDRVSHLIESLEWSGNNIIGRAKILDTPMGIIARKLIEGGVQLGVSTRGLGTLKMLGNGIKEVQSDYVLNTFDIVGDPSAPEAFVQGILEGKEWFIDNSGLLQERTMEDIKRGKMTEERMLQEFEQFLSNYRNTHRNQ